MQMIKENNIKLPNDPTILQLEVSASGQVNLQAPNLDPLTVYVLLNKVGVEVLVAFILNNQQGKINVPDLKVFNNGDKNN